MRCLAGLVIAAAVFIAACGGGSNSRATATPGPLPAGLQTTLERVASLRGLPVPAGLRFAFVARSDVPALLDRLMTDDDRRTAANTTTLYRLLGHLRADQDYASVSRELTAATVVGLYSPQDRTLWVVHPDGEAGDATNLPRDEQLALAHELTHAVQDGQAGLAAAASRLAGDLDANLTWTCVVEGDAVDIARQYGAKYLALPSGGFALLADLRAPLADVPASVSRELLFPYEEGATWLAQMRGRYGQARVDQWLSQPPAAGTAAVLHPELLEAGTVPERVELPSLAAALGSGWERQSGGTFGEFELRNYLQLRLPASQAVAAAAGWRGDHYDVYVHGGESAAVFRIRFADGTEADQFREAQGRFLAGVTASERTENGITVAALNDGRAVARLPGGAAGEVIFVIGSNEAAAVRAAHALAGG